MANISTWHGLPKDRPPTSLELIKDGIDPQMRQVWAAPPGKLLVGVDADSIQLRILAHYMNDERFIESLISGDKKNGTDAHTLNQSALNSGGEIICQSRDDAKTFIYAWLLGAGIQKVSQILGCTMEQAKYANDSFLDYYPGLKYLKTVTIPLDAEAGYFRGFDGRFVKSDEYHMLAGYLQNGEQCIMKTANLIWRKKLQQEKIPFKQVNFVHDEWQTEVDEDMNLATYVAQVQADSIKEVGELFKLNCPLLGTYTDGKKTTIGKNWYTTH
jgi:DNA polymerase-1